jgi:hypothetical protein
MTADVRGIVCKIVNGNIAVVDTTDGGEAWIPTCILVVVLG